MCRTATGNVESRPLCGTIASALGANVVPVGVCGQYQTIAGGDGALSDRKASSSISKQYRVISVHVFKDHAVLENFVVIQELAKHFDLNVVMEVEEVRVAVVEEEEVVVLVNNQRDNEYIFNSYL